MCQLVSLMNTHFNVNYSFKHEFIIQVCGHIQSITDGFKISWQFKFGSFFRINNRTHQGQGDNKHFKDHKLHPKQILKTQKYI